MKKSELVKIIKEEIAEVYGSPVNKEILKADVQASVNDLKNITQGVDFDRNISRFAAGSKSELYTNVYFENPEQEKAFIQAIENKYPVAGVTVGIAREVYRDKDNNIYFRIVRISNSESSIIFNRRMPKGR
jgi:hypothetical protein